MPELLRVPRREMPALSPARSTRVAFLMNVIAPYHKPLLDRLTLRYPLLRIFLSTSMEPNRSWKLAWEGLDVTVQKTVTLNRRWRHPKGFSEPLFVHLPLDTIQQLASFHPDVIVSWEMGIRTMLAALYARLHAGVKLIVWAEFAESTEHGRGSLRRNIRRILHRAIDGFIVTGGSGARYLAGLGVPARKLHQIVYTVDVHRFAAVPLARPTAVARRLLYVGQLIERKGLPAFLDALAQWAARNPASGIEFFIAGDGPLRPKLESTAVPQNLHLKFLGDVAYERLPEVYAQAGIFVFPTLADTWGVVVNEALAAGLPVLGSSYGQAVSELVEHQVNGWTFRPDAPTAISGALGQALSTPLDQLGAMRERARATALQLTPDYVTDLVDAAIVFQTSGKGVS